MNASSDTLIALGWAQLWQVTAVTLAVGILVRVTCRRHPHLAYALWMVVLVKCLTPPVWSSPTGIFSWVQLHRVERAAGAEKLGLAGMPAMAEPFVGPDEEATSAVTAAPAPAKPTRTRRNPLSRGDWFVLAWLVGAAVLTSWLAIKWLGACRWLASSCVSADARWQALTDALCRRLGMRRRVRLLAGDASLGPAALGIFRPKILLPALLLESKPLAQIEPILAHELMHVRRRDPAVGKLQLLAQVLWWFHPLIWWANRELRRQRERACDEEVLARLGCRPVDYARSVLEVLEWRVGLRPSFAFPGLRPWEVTCNRLEDIMSKSKRFNRRMPRWYWVLVATAIALVLPGAGVTLHDRADGEQSQLSPVIRDHYAVFPITTELQRVFLFGTDADVVVVVDVDSIVKDGDFHPEALDVESLRKDLSQYADNRKDRTLFIRLRMSSRAVKDAAEARKAAYSQLESIARKAGFANVRPGRSFTTGEWMELAERLRTFGNESDVKDERPIGNDLVRVYPVQTKLSRYLTYESDCVVDVLAQFAKDEPRLDAKVRDAVERFVPELELREHGKLWFRIWTLGTPDESYQTSVRFSNGEALELAKSLGFQDREVSGGTKPPKEAPQRKDR